MAETDEQPRNNSGSGQPHAPRAVRRASAGGEGTGRGSAPSAELETDTLEEQVAQLQSELKSITGTLARMGQTASHDFKATARARTDELAARGQSALSTAQDEFSQIERQLKDSIRQKPLTAVAGAVALGFLIAVLTR